MRLHRWILVTAVLYGMLSSRELPRLRVQHVRIAMTRLGPKLIYGDFGT